MDESNNNNDDALLREKLLRVALIDTDCDSDSSSTGSLDSMSNLLVKVFEDKTGADDESFKKHSANT